MVSPQSISRIGFTIEPSVGILLWDGFCAHALVTSTLFIFLGLYDLLGFRVAAECRKHNIPYVVEPIGMFVPIVRNLPLKHVYHRLFGRELLAGAAAIIATADQEKAELIAGGISKDKIVVRRNGVDVPASLPPRGAFRVSLQIPEDAKLLLFLGRLSSKKSPDLLLRAFADVINRQKLPRNQLHLAFVGPDEGGMLRSLQSATSKLDLAGSVHFVPPLSGDSKWSAYRDADIFVLPSQNENFGNTAAESVAAGTPVILSDHCGIAPLLAGIAGLAVPHNQAQLAGCDRILAPRRFSLSQAAKWLCHCSYFTRLEPTTERHA